ncbi:MAG: hypothetical protein ACR2RB_17025 [Gammaproteobacteria bacterium]
MNATTADTNATVADVNPTIADLLLRCCEMLADRADKWVKESKVGIVHTVDDLLETSQTLTATADALQNGEISSDTCLRLEQALSFVQNVISWEAIADSRLTALCDQLSDALISPRSISYALIRNASLIVLPSRRFFFLIGEDAIRREAQGVSAKQLEQEVRKIRAVARAFRAAAETLNTGQQSEQLRGGSRTIMH